MKFALVDGFRLTPYPKGKGLCPHCGSPMIARCGKVKLWHWAHKGRPACDPWWENETTWHRRWKDKFPSDWQEIGHVDPRTGERHIADVKTPHGLVIEFQHSAIKPEERQIRENFYQNIIWIVNGNRRPLDKSYFNLGLQGPIQENPLAYQVNWIGKSRLLHDWADAKAKVYIDFGEGVLWRLVFFDSDEKVAGVGPALQSWLIDDCCEGRTIRVAQRKPVSARD